jgi:hypothetical protein
MGGPFSTSVERRNAYRLLVGKPEGKRPLRRPRRRWVDNIGMDLGEVGWGDMDWIDLAQDGSRWRAVVNSVLNLRVPWNAEKLSSGLTSSGLSSSALLLVSYNSEVINYTFVFHNLWQLLSKREFWYFLKFGRQSSGSGLESREYGRSDPSHWPHNTLYPQKLALTSPTSGGRLVGIIHSRTQATEFINWMLVNQLRPVSKNFLHCTFLAVVDSL